MHARTKIVGVVLAAGAAAGLLAAAPASASHPNYAEQYLTDVGPYNAAGATFSKEAATWTSSTSITTAARAATPLAGAGTTLIHVLLGQHWPANVQAAVDSLAIETGALDGYLGSLGSSNGLTLGTWAALTSSSEGASAAAADVVRAGLGLPLRR